jgi:hypothetical protein
MNKYMKKYKIPIIITINSLWCSLGLYRGGQNYEYEYKQIRYERIPYLYIYKFNNSIYYGIYYMCPLLFPFILSKEIYRLEVYLRKLENEKKKIYYYEIF